MTDFWYQITEKRETLQQSFVYNLYTLFGSMLSQFTTVEVNMKLGTRRNFLRVAAGASLLAGTSLRASMAPRKVRAWCTSESRKFEEINVPQWQSFTGESATALKIDVSKQFQEILGFGAAFTDASCFLFSQMPAGPRRALYFELFGDAGLRLSVGRTCIGASDYSLTAYNFDESLDPDPDLTKFTIDHDRGYILPVLRAAREMNPDLFLFSTPWSPPGWMKANGSMLGGSMRKKYLASYADYFVRFLRAYSAEGVNINAVTVQNEVDTDQDGRMPAALWGQEYEIEFVGKHLGPALERTAIDTKIWILDHNYSLAGRALDELNDPAVNKYTDGIAWHGYVGSPDVMTRVHDSFPSKSAYWTEGGPDITSPDYATDWVKWSQKFAQILRNWARCVVGWNFILDEKGRPNIGPFPCGGLVTLDSQTQMLTRSGQYWAMSQYSKLVRRGARVIGSQGGPNNVDHVAFQNPDGSSVLVLTNPGSLQQVQCQVASQALELTLDPGSITSLTW
jgi:glucosylceramidase